MKKSESEAEITLHVLCERCDGAGREENKRHACKKCAGEGRTKKRVKLSEFKEMLT